MQDSFQMFADSFMQATFTVHKDLETLRVMFHDGQFSGPITGNPPVETCGGMLVTRCRSPW
jgi:hypothetical protein